MVVNLYQNLNWICVVTKTAVSHNSFTLLSVIIGKLRPKVNNNSPGDPGLNTGRDEFVNQNCVALLGLMGAVTFCASFVDPFILSKM
jgi:hypothetical protein